MWRSSAVPLLPTLSVQAPLSILSHVPCFCQGEGERPHEILDLAHGLLVVPVALLHLVKGKKGTGAVFWHRP